MPLVAPPRYVVVSGSFGIPASLGLRRAHSGAIHARQAWICANLLHVALGLTCPFRAVFNNFGCNPRVETCFVADVVCCCESGAKGHCASSRRWKPRTRRRSYKQYGFWDACSWSHQQAEWIVAENRVVSHEKIRVWAISNRQWPTMVYEFKSCFSFWIPIYPPLQVRIIKSIAVIVQFAVLPPRSVTFFAGESIDIGACQTAARIIVLPNGS